MKFGCGACWENKIMKKTALLAGILFSAAIAGGAENVLIKENFDGKPVQWATGRGERGASISTAEVKPQTGTENSAAIVWHYDFSMDEPAGTTYVRLRPEMDIPGEPVRFTVRVKGDKSGLPLCYRLRDASGRTWQYTLGNIDFDGWKEFDVTLDPARAYAWGGTVRPDKGFSFPLRFDEFMLDYGKPAAKVKGDLIIDDLQFYGAAVEREEF